MSKKRAPVRFSNAFASLGSDPPNLPDPQEEQLAEHRLDAQRADQIQTLRKLQEEEKNIERDIEMTDKLQRQVQRRTPVRTPKNTPFNPLFDESRRYGIIKEKDAADIENSIFQRLRTSMFKTGKGGMFMFGTPDEVY